MTIKEGDKLRYRVERGVLLAGSMGVCRINSFEKSRRGNVVYIDTKMDDGTYFERFARYAPFEIAFAPLESGEFAVYHG